MTDTTTTPGAPPAPPTNAAEAGVRLGELKADKAWTDKLLAGDVATGAEYNDLHALIATGDNVDVAMAGVLPDVPDASVRLMANVAEHLREQGIPDAAIRQALAGQPVSAAEHALVTRWKAERMSDRDWTKKYLAGDKAAAREMTLANIVINGGIAKAA